MEYESSRFRSCGLKIKTFVTGVPSYGSGVVYKTHNNYLYDYILTVKHIFQESHDVDVDFEDLSHIEISYHNEIEFTLLEKISPRDLKKRLIIYDEDFVIILIEKNDSIIFDEFVLSDFVLKGEKEFYSWSIYSKNLNEIQCFDYKINDASIKRFKLQDPPHYIDLPGISGSGLFSKNNCILYGIIRNIRMMTLIIIPLIVLK